MRNHRYGIAMVVFLASLFLLLAPSCSQLSPEAKKAIHQERGDAYFEEGKYREALIEYKNIVQIDPGNANAHYQVALTHMRLGGLSGFGPDHSGGAIKAQ